MAGFGGEGIARIKNSIVNNLTYSLINVLISIFFQNIYSYKYVSDIISDFRSIDQLGPVDVPLQLVISSKQYKQDASTTSTEVYSPSL